MKSVEKKIKPEKKQDKIEEAIDVLKVQINHHNTMLIKAQGALEVLMELNNKGKDDSEATD